MKNIKEKADRVKTLNESGLSGLPLTIAKAMIKQHGFYTYVDAKTQEKVYIS